jgi:hypothetical protein
VITYSLQYGSDVAKLVDYEKGKIFKGNSDKNTVVLNVLNPPIITRYIRLLPKSWYKHLSMRFELYGCPPGI